MVDYKKIFKSRAIRIKIMRMLSFIPDKIMLQWQYKMKTGRKLNLDDPTRYTEKLQYYKLYYREPLMAQCVDKCEVRKYVEACGLQEILTPIYGVYASEKEIDWDLLPNQFVAKDTLGGGGNDVLICKDKNLLNKESFYQIAGSWVKPQHGKHPGREWVYDNVSHRILIEQYIPSKAEEGGLIDFKAFCFDGKVCFWYVIADRIVGKGAGLGIYDREFNRLPYERADEFPLKREIQRPENYQTLLEYAEILSKPFPHARIDFYNQEGKIRFGEITFFDGSGYMTFKPDEFDEIMGACFDISQMK